MEDSDSGGGRTKEIFQAWSSECLNTPASASSASASINEQHKISNKLAHAASQYFASCTNADEDMAQLFFFLGPALQSEDNECAVRALHVIRGGFMGINSPAVTKSTMQRQSSQFLKEETVNLLQEYLLARCSSEHNDSDVVIAALQCIGSLFKSCTASYALETAQVAVQNAQITSLMRAGRSACYQLLTTAVDMIVSLGGVDSVDDSLATSFATFCASSLRGEKDPRCLLAVLRLLHKCQISLRQECIPHNTFFESACVYYPISFTPPPNDPYKISRKDLQVALRNVLCYEKIPASLVLNLFVQQLIEEDEFVEEGGDSNDSICRDRCDVVDNLTTWLCSKETNNIPKGPLLDLNELELQELADALVQTHEWCYSTGSIDVTTKKQEKSPNKILAEKCSNLACYAVKDLEANETCWSSFCVSSTRSLSARIGEMPESLRGRSAVEYLSVLARAGPKTRRLCVNETIPNLLNKIKVAASAMKQKSDSSIDCDRVAASCGAIGKILGVKLLKNDGGVVFHPDPLAVNANDALIHLRSIAFTGSDNSTERGRVMCSIAAIYAIGSILSNHNPDKEEFQSILNSLVNTVCNGKNDGDGEYIKKCLDRQFRLACARTFGTILWFLKQNDDNRFSILVTKLIDSSASSLPRNEAEDRGRYDTIALTQACSFDEELAGVVVKQLINILSDYLQFENLKSNVNSDSVLAGRNSCVAIALSSVLRNGGHYAMSAWQNSDASTQIMRCLWSSIESGDKKVVSCCEYDFH